ncbi:XRE family transcriptional regulator [Halostreptopolyspora alba]|uniref:XRE family transcriptional regulator n=2 Tax=Halostreptopolyspora alba TaxID=2487137 RepID=A0A3N0ECP5_9ACTN|nr:XRE family transcriptional regulator [Nocardiopsaceae bacterium YIM 96095]
MVSAIERGTRACKPEYAEEIDVALNTGGKIRRLVESMNSRPGLPDWFRDTERLQRIATEIREFQLGLIPGLLQTEDYARVLLRAGEPTASEEQVEALVQARIARQELLWGDSPPRFFAVLDEGVLVRPVGGREIMSRQLEWLLSASESAHVVVQVVPMSTAPHPGLDGSFQLIKLERDRVEQALVLETRVSGAPEDEPERVGEYVRVFEDLRASALPPAASYDLIRKVQGEFQ